jgi:hypothetical protein
MIVNNESTGTEEEEAVMAYMLGKGKKQKKALIRSEVSMTIRVKECGLEASILGVNFYLEERGSKFLSYGGNHIQN